MNLRNVSDFYITIDLNIGPSNRDITVISHDSQISMGRLIRACMLIIIYNKMKPNKFRRFRLLQNSYLHFVFIPFCAAVFRHKFRHFPF